MDQELNHNNKKSLLKAILIVLFNTQEAGLLDTGIKSDLDLGIQYDGADVHYDTEEVTYESEVHVEDVQLGDTNVYFNVGLESESDHSEVLSLPSTSEETVTVTVREVFYLGGLNCIINVISAPNS